MNSKYLLRVQYRLRAHDMASFEKILISQVVPLAEELGLNLSGVWRSFIGNAGEYIEHWEFDSMDDLEKGLEENDRSSRAAEDLRNYRPHG